MCPRYQPLVKLSKNDALNELSTPVDRDVNDSFFDAIA